MLAESLKNDQNTHPKHIGTPHGGLEELVENFLKNDKLVSTRSQSSILPTTHDG